MIILLFIVFFFTQKTAYEMRISDWSSDVCSSDLVERPAGDDHRRADRRVPRQLLAGAQCGPFDRDFLARLSGVALDVLGAGDPGRAVSHPAAADPGQPALPRQDRKSVV